MTREEAREYIIKHCNPHRDTGTQWDDAMECAIKALEEPERKKGKWLVDEDGNMECTFCGNTCGFGNYCNECGADMRGESDE